MGKKRRGIILISTLFLIFLLVLMSSAFLNINSNNLRLTVNVKNQELAVLAAMSGVQYAKMRIEQYINEDSATSWGGADRVYFAKDIPSGANDGFDSIAEDALEGVVNGTLRGGEAAFRMVFTHDAAITEKGGTPTSFNNIWNPAAQDRGTLRSVPARCAHLIVVGTAGGVSRTVEVLLKKQALTNSSAFAGKDLKVGTTSNGLWSINSLDPFDNSVRANGDIIAPSLGVLPDPLPTLFSSTPSPNITFTGGGSGPLDPGGASLGAIVAKKNIIFAPTITSPPVITIGDGGNDTEETAYVKQQTGGVLYPNTESTPPPNLSASSVTPGAGKCIYTIASGVYNMTAHDKIKLPTGIEDDKVPFSTNGSCASSPDLKVNEYMLRIPKDINVQVTGSFTLTTTLVNKQAKLGLGYDDDGVQEVGTSPNFHVKGGDVTINGELTGEGGVVAEKGNVTLNGKSVLSTDPSYGVAVYADGNVAINPPVLNGITSGNSDFIAYKNAVSNATTLQTGLKTGNWLNNWGGSNPSEKGKDAETLRETSVGTATWAPDYMGGATGKLTINPTDKSPPIIISIPSPLPTLTIYGVNFDSTPKNIILGRYVRAKKCEDSEDLTLLAAPWDGGDLSVGDVQSIIESKIEEVFWSDKEQIENQLASKLESLPGADRFKDDTWASPNSYCSGCNTYEKYKDNDALVSFPDYWQGPFDPTVAAKFDSGKQTKYNTNYRVLWGNSEEISQTLDQQDAEFTGLIYTKGDISVNLGGHRFFIEGAVIAQNGDITINNASNVSFLYNPEYLTKFVNQGVGGVQCQLAQVFWVMW